MMTGRHTPGPWRCEKPKHILWGGSTGAFEIYAGETLICQRPWAEGNPQAIREYEANAHLIAAAPDLMEALEAQEAANNHWDNCDECQDIGWCEAGSELLIRAHDLRVAAIAKAKGEG